MNLLELEPYVISEALEDKIFLFYGEAGTRKTTVAAQFDDCLLAAFEIGYKFINGVVAQPLQKWTDFKRFVRELSNPKVKDRFKIIAIDTISLAYSACYDYVLQQEGVGDPGDIGYGKGWRLIRKEFEKTILSIPQMGYGLVLIAHADDMETDAGFKSKVDIDKRPAAIIKGLADFIFYLKKAYKDGEEKTMKNQTVYAYTQLVDIESKTRSRYFAPRFEFTYENLKEEMRLAIDEQKKVEGIITVEHEEYSLHEIVEEDFDTIKSNVLALGRELLGTPAEQLVLNTVSEIMEGVPVPESSNIHKPKLIILHEKLLEIKSRL